MLAPHFPSLHVHITHTSVLFAALVAKILGAPVDRHMHKWGVHPLRRVRRAFPVSLLSSTKSRNNEMACFPRKNAVLLYQS